ncbi:hypothetical protein ABT47_05785 [Shewanella xiamenensis]|nr:hypothetical protein ABT47_05785 [Shewanella xiamenensis]
MPSNNQPLGVPHSVSQFIAQCFPWATTFNKSVSSVSVVLASPKVFECLEGQMAENPYGAALSLGSKQ